MDQDFSKQAKAVPVWGELGRNGAGRAAGGNAAPELQGWYPAASQPSKAPRFQRRKGEKKKISQPQIINKRDESLERNSTKPQVALCLGRFC